MFFYFLFWYILSLCQLLSLLFQLFPAYNQSSLCHFRLDEFMTGFNIISLKLKEMYQVSGATYLFWMHTPESMLFYFFNFILILFLKETVR